MTGEIVVTTRAGAVRGVGTERLAAFHAIPYAAPPLGAMRFAAPRPPVPWTGVRDCTVAGASPPQGPSRLDAVMGVAAFAQSEDCLTLTVWTPAADDARRPVMIWFHGGAYQSGGGHQPFYDGANLARAGDIVVVSINYRLGALGYLYLPEVEAAGGAPANRGLLDQIAALGWVKDNIAAFGGDPDAITVAGQSAGGGSTLALLAEPSARAMIGRAILQSPSTSTLTPDRASEITARFYAAAGVRPGDVARLGEMPVAEIVAAHRKVQLDIAATGDRTIACQLVAPATACAVAPFTAIRQGAAAAIPMLIGTTLDEGHAWLAQDDGLVAETSFDAIVQKARASRMDAAAADLPADRRAAARKPWELLSAMLTWATFEKPARRVADGHAQHGGAAWVYRFDWRPTRDARFGACHCIEIPFVFDNLERWPPAGMMDGHDRASFQRLARTTQAAWVSFIRTGRPGAPGLPEWPQWSAAARPCMVLDDTCRLANEAG